jgi:hypothetical protein
MRDHPEGAWFFDPYRLIPSTFAGNAKPFVHVDRVVAKEIQGEPNPYYVDGLLQFPDGYVKEDGAYKMVFGPCMHHYGVILSKTCPINQRYGLTRLTAIREPLRPGFHYELGDNQEAFARDNQWLKSIIEHCNQKVTAEFHHFIDNVEAQIEEAALNPFHQKFRLRKPAWQDDICRGGQYKHKTWIVKNNGYVVIKTKGRELAKPDKYIRITYDLGTPASLAAGFAVERIKEILSQIVASVHGCEFVKSPDLAALTATFENLINPRQDAYFCYFSDDSCISIVCIDGVFRANIDISSCDASHRRAVFTILRQMCKGNTYLEALIERAIAQCENDLIIRSTVNPRHKVKFSVSEPILYTGSILTTLINNIANLMIYAAIRTQMDLRKFRVSECKAMIVDAARSAGYIVTIDVAHNVQQLQFLKHSPCYAVSGNLVPVLNLGVIGRTMGSCWGDLPMFKPSQSFGERVDEYNRRQVSCFKRGARHSILQALVDRYNPSQEVIESSVFIANRLEGDQSHEFVPDEQIALRYNCEPHELQEIALHYSKGNRSFKTRASALIMQKDYGIGIRT